MAALDGLQVGSTHFSNIGSGERSLQANAAVAALDAPALLLGDLNAAIEAPELEPFADWTDAFAEPPADLARVSTDDEWQIDQVLGRGPAVGGARVLRESGDLSDHYPVVATVEGIRGGRRLE